MQELFMGIGIGGIIGALITALFYSHKRIKQLEKDKKER